MVGEVAAKADHLSPIPSSESTCGKILDSCKVFSDQCIRTVAQWHPTPQNKVKKKLSEYNEHVQDRVLVTCSFLGSS